MSVKFILHTELNANPPVFTLSCLTQGGPPAIQWTLEQAAIESIDHETSQVIVDTTYLSVYNNTLTVRERKNGTYNCVIKNAKQQVGGNYFVEGKIKLCRSKILLLDL